MLLRVECISKNLLLKEKKKLLRTIARLVNSEEIGILSTVTRHDTRTVSESS